MPSTATLTATEFNGAGAVIPAPTLAWASANAGVFTVPSGGSGGQTAVVTATGVGSSTGTATDPTTAVVGGFVVNVSTSLGYVVLPAGVGLTGTIPALAGGGSGLPVLGFRMRFLVDCLLGTPTAGGLFSIYDSGINLSLEVTCILVGSTIRFNFTAADGEANAIAGTVAQSALPAAGTGVVLYSVYEASGQLFGLALLTDAGGVLFSYGVSAGPVGAGNTPTGNTTLLIGGSHTGPTGGMTIDGAEILTAAMGAPQTPPAINGSDPGDIGQWGFAGVLTPTVVGAALSAVAGGGPGSVTYLSGGLWS
jgi:hypothetical protein